jgi:hypothetical protein
MMVFFSGFFARFHERGSGYIPYELQTVDCPIVGANGVPALDEAGNPLLMRCVREVARSQSGEEESWLMITWEVGIPGVTMTPCGSSGGSEGTLASATDADCLVGLGAVAGTMRKACGRLF